VGVFGTGLGHYIPFVAYLGCWVMCIVSLTGRPLLGLYYMIPFVPYRTMRIISLTIPSAGMPLPSLSHQS
jgi:putative inorganic carbon (HCO3(-)) transporter